MKISKATIIKGAGIVAASSLIMWGYGHRDMPRQRPSRVPLPISGGACDVTSNGTQADTETKVNNALAGQTVCIPAGSFAWGSASAWHPQPNVTIQGFGTTATGGGDVTVLSDNYSVNAPWIALTLPATGSIRVTGITLQTGTANPPPAGQRDTGMLTIFGPGSVRLDHMHWNTTNRVDYKVIDLQNRAYGVVDHSIFDLISTNAIYLYNIIDGNEAGNGVWAEDTAFGSANFFFVEDNIINGSAADHSTRVYDCINAGRVVVRFNTLTNSTLGETHATGTSADARGCRAQEAYGNLNHTTVDPAVNVMLDLLHIANGGTLAWGNHADPPFSKHVFIMSTFRESNAEGKNQTPTPGGWGYCGTSSALPGAGSAWDQNINPANGYACLDQVGRGRGDLITGIFPNKINSTTGTIAWPHQALEPVYVWANVAQPAPGWGGTYYAGLGIPTIQADRDFYTQASGIQTSVGNPFNGTTGTGWGPIAFRPSSCTTGVGYFATDQGSWNTSASNPFGWQQNGASGLLYKCDSTNSWALYYTPFIYPHPLQGGGGPPPPTSPAAPTNLRVLP